MITLKKYIHCTLIVVFQLFITINCNSENILKILYLNEAKQLIPTLYHQASYPVSILKIEKDLNAWLGWKSVIVSTVKKQDNFKVEKGDTLILDFGRNMVGYLNGVTQTKAVIKIETAEVLAELGDRWEQYSAIFDNGYKPLKSWSPIVLNVDKNWYLNDRLTFRYVRLIIQDASTVIKLSDLYCDEVSAVPLNKIIPLEGYSKKMEQIDLVAQYTLRNCIQEVFEDGPKRDQRLWLGDLRIEALPDDLLFKSDSLVKRCLLLFAGSTRDDGFIPACVYTPRGRDPEIGDEMIPDYAMLFGSVLLNYSTNTNDWTLAKRLYPLACQQVDLVCEKWLNSNNYLEISNSIWQFIDWNKDLDRQTAEQATAIYSIESLLDLAGKLGINEDIVKWESLIKKMKEASMKHLYNKEKGLFISGPQYQVSWASQVWMILAGVVDKEIGAQILNRVKADTNAIKPGCAYLMHHLVEAYLICGMDEEAYNLIESYWGGMIDKGADTYWEVFDQENPYKSPYNSHLFNSYCHGWSCTPTWFLRHPAYGKRLQSIDEKMQIY